MASKVTKAGAALVTSLLALGLFWTIGAAETILAEGKAVSAAAAAPAAQNAGAASPNATPNCPPPDKNLKFVVALFRHGVRAPLSDLGTKHSKEAWPKIEDWRLSDDQWGYLTPHGATAAKILGAYYGSHYSNAWGKGFKTYLWADSLDERTIATAWALREGMQSAGAKVTVGFLQPAASTDPLFHPFQANCGTPEATELNRIVGDINTNWSVWLSERKALFCGLYGALACTNPCESQGCEPLTCITDNATPSSTKSPRPPSPIKWQGQSARPPNPTDGQFPYASTATEVFLLEYADGMDPKKVGWGSLIDKTGSTDKLCKLLDLHEFYFEKTEREPYLAGVDGANLVREILDQLNQRSAGRFPIYGKCPRPSGDSQFVGLVGHDTNLANVQKLLHVEWSFTKDGQLPADVRNLPGNDALPAGALVFELRAGSPDYKVRIQYVTQSLNEIRDAPKPGDPYCIRTTCLDDNGKDVTPCEMSLGTFNKVAGDVIKAYKPFLSGCNDGTQVCPAPPAPSR